MCLQYIILALGATISHQHKDLALPFYHRARRYIDHDDMTVSISWAHTYKPSVNDIEASIG